MGNDGKPMENDGKTMENDGKMMENVVEYCYITMMDKSWIYGCGSKWKTINGTTDVNV